jgi:hypothetical protein
MVAKCYDRYAFNISLLPEMSNPEAIIEILR